MKQDLIHYCLLKCNGQYAEKCNGQYAEKRTRARYKPELNL